MWVPAGKLIGIVATPLTTGTCGRYRLSKEILIEPVTAGATTAVRVSGCAARWVAFMVVIVRDGFTGAL